MMTQHQAAHIVGLARKAVEANPSERARKELDKAEQRLAAAGAAWAAKTAIEAIGLACGWGSAECKEANGYYAMCY